MKFDPSTSIHDYLVFGEFGDVNPSITDSSTFTFRNPAKMDELFDHEIEGCFLYSRHWNPINKFLSNALTRLEDSECAQVTSSGNSLLRDMNGEIHFYRASNEKSDFKIAFKPGEEGIQILSSAGMDKGVWKVKFSLLDDNENKYFIEKNIFIN